MREVVQLIEKRHRQFFEGIGLRAHPGHPHKIKPARRTFIPLENNNSWGNKALSGRLSGVSAAGTAGDALTAQDLRATVRDFPEHLRMLNKSKNG
jgi:hypothetical protein